METLHQTIKSLERDLAKIKFLHSLGKITNDSAREQVKILERQLMTHVDKLPPYEREQYMIRKEFGKEF